MTHRSLATAAVPEPERAFWDAQFRFSTVIAGFAAHLEQDAQRSAAFRRQHGDALTRAYGTDARQFVRSCLAPGRPEQACIFVHGGYWRALSADGHDFVGSALPPDTDFHNVEYRLQPRIGFGAQIDDVTRAILATLEICAERKVRQVHLVGHSAGAHLAFCAAQRLGNAAMPVHSLCAISGIYDLEPISRSFLANEIRFTPADIAEHSPLRQTGSFADIGYFLAVGGEETSEYLRQTFALATQLERAGNRVRLRVLANAHHLQTVDVFLAAADTPFMDARPAKAETVAR